ncbi:hypothetical protein MC885_004469, partial [Smutsia gigantea]
CPLHSCRATISSQSRLPAWSPDLPSKLDGKWGGGWLGGGGGCSLKEPSEGALCPAALGSSPSPGGCNLIPRDAPPSLPPCPGCKSSSRSRGRVQGGSRLLCTLPLNPEHPEPPS